MRWGAVELAWSRGETAEALSLLEPLLDAGSFVSPLDTVRWADRLLAAGESGSGEVELARRCLHRARRWMPEIPRVWNLLGTVAWQEGKREEAHTLWERALALDPQDL